VRTLPSLRQKFGFGIKKLKKQPMVYSGKKLLREGGVLCCGFLAIGNNENA
jgi:hypothetical protein